MRFILVWLTQAKSALFDVLRLRIWIIFHAVCEIWRRAWKRSEWTELSPRVLSDQFAHPFLSGHIPPDFHMAVFETEDQFLLSTKSIINKVKFSLRELSLEPYRYTGVLNGLAKAALAHYEKCEYCQNQSVLYFAEMLQDRWIRKEIQQLIG